MACSFIAKRVNEDIFGPRLSSDSSVKFFAALYTCSAGADSSQGLEA